MNWRLDLAYLAVFGIVQGPPSELEVPPLPSLEGAGLLQQDALLHAFLCWRRGEKEKRKTRQCNQILRIAEVTATLVEFTQGDQFR